MKYITALILYCILSVFSAKMSRAQDGISASHSISYTIPHVAMVDIEGGSNVNLDLSTPTDAGLGMEASATNSSLWLNYSSTTNPSATNSVKVKVDALVPGINIRVTAAADANGGIGTTGSPSSVLTLQITDQNLINNIGTCYTGDGINKGHNITYSMVTTSYNLIKYEASPSPITITYTITNN
jgi:hypothetical protein